MAADYSTITETRAVGLTAEALMMNRVRYGFAAAHAAGRDVLEVACGVGQGLGALRRLANRLVAGDYTITVLREANVQYRGRVPLVQFDAHELPFGTATFDTVVFFEALYYLRDLHRFCEESRRILRAGGRLLICTVNPEWSGFNPSPFSTRYYSGKELKELLEACGFTVELFGAFPQHGMSGRALAVAAVRRAAVLLHAIPTTMRGKEMLKRIFYGKLQHLPPELEVADPEPWLIKLGASSEARGLKEIYAIATVSAMGRAA